jgi:hypothetical protein
MCRRPSVIRVTRLGGYQPLSRRRHLSGHGCGLSDSLSTHCPHDFVSSVGACRRQLPNRSASRRGPCRTASRLGVPSCCWRCSLGAILRPGRWHSAPTRCRWRSWREASCHRSLRRCPLSLMFLPRRNAHPSVRAVAGHRRCRCSETKRTSRAFAGLCAHSARRPGRSHGQRVLAVQQPTRKG